MIYFLQLVSDNQTLLFSYGPLGIICAWFMFRAEKLTSKVSDLGHRIDGLTKALLIDMINRDNVGPTTKEYVKETIAKIDARTAQGNR